MSSPSLPPCPHLQCPSLLHLCATTCLLGAQTFLEPQVQEGPSPTQIEAPGHPHPSFVPIPGGLSYQEGAACLPWGPRITKYIGSWCERWLSQPLSAPRLFPPPVCGTRKLWELGDTTPQGVYLPQGVAAVTQRCSQARMLTDASVKLAERE